MAMKSVSHPRDNSLEELRVVIEEKKGEVKRKFAELKKLLEMIENTATYRLDRIYTDVRKDVERNERTVTQLEKAKNDLNSTLVDNNTNLFLQTANQNIDTEIAKARNSTCVIPKHISLRWSIEELKQSIENVCEVISSLTAETPVSTEQPNKIELEGVRKELEQRTKELVSLQEEKLQMQLNYENEISNLKSSLEELNYNCSSLKAELQKQSEYSKHTLTTESANTEDRITSLTTHITTLFVNGKYSHFYTLSQVNNPSELVGELVVCRAKRKYVIGTLKVVIPAKLRYENTIAGIEFTNEFGNCSGSYKGITYFKTNSKCALFIPTTEVFIYYNGRIS